jgi:hypothetical protein
MRYCNSSTRILPSYSPYIEQTISITMKKQFLKTAFSTLIISGLWIGVNAQVGIGTTTPHASAVLDLTSTTQGFLPPRMTQAQRNAISSPASGLMVWCTNCGAAGELQGYNGTTWTNLTGGTASAGIITGLTCGSATNSGTLTSGTAASGVSSAVPYTGGNGATHSGQTVTSTGVTGLTATLSAGTFASGSGSLTYNITGTPASSGTATFALNIGGQTCSLTRTVNFICSTSTVTFNYNGASVTYGTVTGANSTCWLDRNLGATQVATSSADYLAYGDLFQWGRGADGHQLITWTSATTVTAVNGTTETLSSSDTPGNALFITNNTDPLDWRSPKNDNLWQGVSGTNNPCPSGYRLPTKTELDAELSSWSTPNAAGAFASPLKLPLGVRRAKLDGSFPDPNLDGYYWSSTVSGTNSYFLNFNTGAGEVYPVVRAFGFSVRCIKD